MRVWAKAGLLWVCALVCITALTGPVYAGPESVYFDVYLRGVRVGEVRFNGRTDPGYYEMQGVMGSRGFFGFLIGARYSGAVIGSRNGSRLQPEVFRGRFDYRRQFAQVDIKFQGRRPVSVTRTPERPAQPHDVPPARASGSVDPISGAWMLLRDVPESGLCKQTFKVFEGTRLSQIVAFPADNEDPELRSCNGAYNRIAGFTAEQLAEATQYPFRLDYRQRENGDWYLDQFLMTTYWGTAQGVRRR